MARINKRVVVLAGVGLVILLAMVAVWKQEPLHKGKAVSYWVDRACLGYDANEAWKSRGEVKNIGPSAIPHLVRRLRASDGWRKSYGWLRTHLPTRWQQRLPDVHSAKEIRYGAVRTLAMFGPDAKPAVADLVPLLPSINHPVIEALRAIGPGAKDSLPALHAMLTNRDVSIRVETAWAIWCIGWETNTVLEICTNALMLDSINAGALLSELLTAAAPAVPYALNVLQGTNHLLGARSNAAIILGAARVSTPEIRAALLDGTQVNQDAGLRSNCAMALWRLDSQYAPLATRLVLEAIAVQRQRFPGNEQDFTLWCEIRDLDPQQSIPTLKELLESDSPDTRKEAAEALRRIEAKTRAGQPQKAH